MIRVAPGGIFGGDSHSEAAEISWYKYASVGLSSLSPKITSVTHAALGFREPPLLGQIDHKRQDSEVCRPDMSMVE